MMDLTFLGLGLAFFALSFGFIALCQKLNGYGKGS